MCAALVNDTLTVALRALHCGRRAAGNYASPTDSQCPCARRDGGRGTGTSRAVLTAMTCADRHRRSHQLVRLLRQVTGCSFAVATFQRALSSGSLSPGHVPVNSLTTLSWTSTRSRGQRQACVGELSDRRLGLRVSTSGTRSLGGRGKCS